MHHNNAQRPSSQSIGWNNLPVELKQEVFRQYFDLISTDDCEPEEYDFALCDLTSVSNALNHDLHSPLTEKLQRLIKQREIIRSMRKAMDDTISKKLRDSPLTPSFSQIFCQLKHSNDLCCFNTTCAPVPDSEVYEEVEEIHLAMKASRDQAYEDREMLLMEERELKSLLEETKWALVRIHKPSGPAPGIVAEMLGTSDGGSRSLQVENEVEQQSSDSDAEVPTTEHAVGEGTTKKRAHEDKDEDDLPRKVQKR